MSVIQNKYIEHLKRKLLSKRLIDSNNCWLWQGAKDKDGYGIIRFLDKDYKVHRLSFFLWKLGFKDDLNTLHKCDVSSCFSPDHLFQGTTGQNIKDMIDKKRHFEQKKTHCKNGHEFTVENTYISPTDNSRQCRICRKSRNKK